MTIITAYVYDYIVRTINLIYLYNNSLWYIVSNTRVSTIHQNVLDICRRDAHKRSIALLLFKGLRNFNFILTNTETQHARTVISTFVSCSWIKTFGFLQKNIKREWWCKTAFNIVVLSIVHFHLYSRVCYLYRITSSISSAISGK